ncbi:MAG: AraC family transcriptional regulator [Woeseia sp.]
MMIAEPGGSSCHQHVSLGLTADNVFHNTRAYRTHVVADAKTDVERVFCRHTLSPTRGEDAIEFCHRKAALWQTSFNYISYGSDVEVAVEHINRRLFIVVVPLSGVADVEHLGKTVQLKRGSYIVLDPMSPFRWWMSRDHAHLAVGVPRSSFCQDDIPGPPPTGPRDIDPDNPGFVEFLEYLCRELDRPFTPLHVPHVAEAVEKSFLSVMRVSLLADSGRLPRSRHEFLTQVPAYIQRAEEFIRDNLQQDVRVEDIIGAAGVSMRTLYRGFEQHRGVTPMRWLRIQRLQLARRDLANVGESGDSVTDIINRYCAPNAGRFARDYRTLFGELPSETLRRVTSITR